MKRKRHHLILAGLLLAASLAAAPAQAGHSPDIEVWTYPGFDADYCAYDEIEVFLQPRRNTYVTVMVIDPFGYATVVYPRHHRQRRLRAGRVYRLSELMEGDPLYFDGIDGRAYISVVTSRRPVFINDWLIDEITAFCRGAEYGGFGIRVRTGLFGGRLEVSWNKYLRSFGYAAFTTPIRLHIDRRGHHLRRHHHPKLRHAGISWGDRYRYRSHKPVVVTKRRPPRQYGDRSRDRGKSFGLNRGGHRDERDDDGINRRRQRRERAPGNLDRGRRTQPQPELRGKRSTPEVKTRKRHEDTRVSPQKRAKSGSREQLNRQDPKKQRSKPEARTDSRSKKRAEKRQKRNF